MTRLTKIRRLAHVALLTSALAAGAAAVTPAAAQVVETPVPFDSAGRIRGVTPGLATRLGLGSPAWPYVSPYMEARLYSTTAGGYVLALVRADGSVERYAITPEQRVALQAAIDSAATRMGRVVSESMESDVSQPARGAFVRNQMIATLLIYGPALATLTGDAKAGTALYLAAAGGAYFALTDLSRRTTITRAQNHLASDGAWRGPLIAMGTLAALGARSEDAKVGAAVVLVGGIGGSYLGYRLGRGWTDGEAVAATAGSTFLTLTSLGVLGTTRGFTDMSEQAVAGVATASAILGYRAGVEYPRRAGYAVTEGDIAMVGLSSALGAAVGLTIVGEEGDDERPYFGALTAGMLAGALAGDRAFARPVDHTPGEAGLVTLGATAGALMGTAAVVLIEPGEFRVAAGLVTGGAILGLVAAERLVAPRRAGAQSSMRTGSAPSQSRLSITPWKRGAMLSYRF